VVEAVVPRMVAQLPAFNVEPVTHAENCRRGDGWKVFGLRTHCPEGHPYDEENTYVYKGKRSCRSCRRDSTREWRARQGATSP